MFFICSFQLFLKPNHYAVFRIGILTPISEGIFLAESYVQTQYEVIKLPFRLRTADGLLSIFPSTILLEDSFPVILILNSIFQTCNIFLFILNIPKWIINYVYIFLKGKISHREIHILSTFGHSMTVEGINPQNRDQRFKYVPPSSAGPQPVLHPDHQSYVGKIVYDPQADCDDSCYVGFSLFSKGKF